MPVGKRLTLQWWVFHYNLVSHLLLSLFSLDFHYVEFITFHPRWPFSAASLTSVCLTQASTMNLSVLLPKKGNKFCLHLCSLILLMAQQSYLWPRFKTSWWAHILKFLLILVTRPLQSMPSLYSPQHWPNSAPVISIIPWIFIKGLCARYHERCWGCDGE